MFDFATIFDIFGTVLFAVVGITLVCELVCGLRTSQN